MTFPMQRGPGERAPPGRAGAAPWASLQLFSYGRFRVMLLSSNRLHVCLLKDFIYFWREEKRRRKGEKHQSVASRMHTICTPARDGTPNPGMCSDLKSNRQCPTHRAIHTGQGHLHAFLLMFYKITLKNCEHNFKLTSKLFLLILNSCKRCNFYLAGVAQWIECWPENQRVTSLIPSQGTCLGCGPGLQ